SEIDSSLAEERKEEPGFTIPMEMNERVEKWIEYFSKTDRERFQRFLNNGEVFKATITDILRREGVPTELFYLGLIESGYHLGARSHANAVGPWQFIYATGRRYGLQADAYNDERRDILRSTAAAARYLRDLY